MTYWEEINSYEEKRLARSLKYIKKQHEYKMKQLEKECEIFRLKAKVQNDP